VRGQQKEGPRAPHHGKAEEKKRGKEKYQFMDRTKHTRNIKKRSIEVEYEG
jgi:hypothetical protein